MGRWVLLGASYLVGCCLAVAALAGVAWVALTLLLPVFGVESIGYGPTLGGVLLALIAKGFAR